MRNTVLKLGIAFIMLNGFFGFCHAQIKADTLNIDEQVIFCPIETIPQYPGGEYEFFCFIDRNLNKQLLQTVDKAGILVAQFTVDTLGYITDIIIVKSLTSIADSEFIRIIGLMPKWIPGKMRDKVVAVKMNIPLRLPYENKFCR